MAESFRDQAPVALTPPAGGRLGSLRGIAISLLLVAALTAALFSTRATLLQDVRLDQVTMIYLIPVLVAATRWGPVPSLIAAIASIGATAFFFYPPIYDFRVHQTEHLVDIGLFIVVALVTGQLADNARRAKIRMEAENLRDALIGSVSHELRTPLASILGSASILSGSQDIAKDARLSGLVRVIGEEADRLNNDIQNLLDATRISSEGIRPHAGWVDPGDIINAAVGRKRRLLAGHRLTVSVADNLPMIHIDSSLVEKALGQLIENAAKYSPPNTTVEVAATLDARAIKLEVRDQGAGLSAEERLRIWDRFYRGPRQRGTVAGSGLGLWIARALIMASGGKIAASSPGPQQGSTFAIHLPVSRHAGVREIESADD